MQPPADGADCPSNSNIRYDVYLRAGPREDKVKQWHSTSHVYMHRGILLFSYYFLLFSYYFLLFSYYFLLFFLLLLREHGLLEIDENGK
jgi:hypothetical protein